jgi:hypothetical protein
VFPPLEQVAVGDPLPPPPRAQAAGESAVQQIVAGNLFETERGAVQGEDGLASADETPLPPPTNVVLNGVFFQTTGRPMAIMTDTSAGSRQLTLQEGDNVGDYQVGEITRSRVTLLGRGGQEFSLELDIGKGAEGSPAPAPTARTPPTAAAVQAQTAAQRAAAARRQQAQQQARARSVQNRGGAEGAAAEDPTQARLEALRRLREAAASHQ